MATPLSSSFFVASMLLLQELIPAVQSPEAETGIGDLVDEELASTAQAVEAAALRIQEMLRKSREDDTGVKLEVNERLLDSCTGLMKAIKILIARSKDLQGEIVGEGMVREREGRHGEGRERGGEGRHGEEGGERGREAW